MCVVTCDRWTGVSARVSHPVFVSELKSGCTKWPLNDVTLSDDVVTGIQPIVTPLCTYVDIATARV